jgi:hypothetical protein
MEPGQPPVRTPEEVTADQQALRLYYRTLDTPDRGPRGPVRYPPARAAWGIGVSGVFMHMWKTEV